MLLAYDFSLKRCSVNVADDIRFGCVTIEMVGVYA